MPTFTNNVTGNEDAIVGVADKGIGVHGTSSESTGTGGVSDSGIGVHGVSKAGPGVRGDAENGTGVFGGSRTSTAVGGSSDSGIGIHGISKTADGVFGNSEKGRGVVGVAKVATGVEGNSTSGDGVFGSSLSGIGVHGKGGRLAGFFEGGVEVTGDLTAKGISIKDLLQRIARLEDDVNNLRNQISPASGGASSGGTTSSIPQIGVIREGAGAGSVFVIEGSGFLPNKTVTVRVVDEGFNTRTFSQSSDASGKIGIRLSLSCISGLTLHFSATDSRPSSDDITGVLWSNTFTTTCP